MSLRQPLDIPSLTTYLTTHTSLAAPYTLTQFGYGQSNPTYSLTTSTNARYVLRKKPPGKLLNKTAHAVEREFRVISALSSSPVPVPEAVILCEDSAVLGSPFYIMSFIAGRIFANPALPGVDRHERRQMWISAIQTLAALHRVDIDSVGLGTFGRKGGFYSRQLKTLRTISAAQAATKDIDTHKAVGEIPGFSRATEYFSRTQPQDRTTVIHGDYKIDNLIFHPTEPRVVGVLDWELSTLGHPLSDLCNLLFPYVTCDSTELAFGRQPGEAEQFAPIPPTASVGRLADATTVKQEELEPRCEGLLPLAEAIRVYEEAAGWKIEGYFGWGEAFGALRNAVITQGIAARYALRVASSERAREYVSQTPKLAGLAERLIEVDRKEREEKGAQEKVDSKL